MANVDRPFGMRVDGTITGYMTGRASQYEVTDGRDDKIAIGQIVKFDGSGYVEPASPGDEVLGVVIGVGRDNETHGETNLFDPDDLTNEGNILDTDETGIVLVADDPQMVFEVQAADDVTDLTVGSSYEFTNNTSMNETAGRAETEISDGTTDTNLRVIAVSRTPDNDPTSEHANYRVVLTNHVYG